MDHHMNNSGQFAQQGMGGMTQGQAQVSGMGASGMPVQGTAYQGASHSGIAQQGMMQQGMGYPMYAPYYSQQNTSLFNDRFLKGLLIGAAAAYLLTNETVQRTAIKGAVKAWSLLQGGVEELKERFHDAEAEVRAEAGE